MPPPKQTSPEVRMRRWLSRILGTLTLLLGTCQAGADGLLIYTEELPPLNYTEGGSLTGLAVEMVQEIKHRTGNQDPIQVVPWARGYKAALELPNVVLFSTTRTEEREKKFKWVGPLTRWSYVFYKKRGSPITLNTLDDARKVGSIATYRDDAREQFLLENNFTNLDRSPKLISCARKLMEGRVDLWLDSNLTAHQIVEKANYDPEELEPVLTVRTNHLYIAFSSQTDDAVVEQWQQALNSMVDDGTYQTIYRKWLPKESPPIIGSHSPELRKLLQETRIYTEDLPPINYLEDDSLTGSAAEIVHEILRRIGLPTNITVVPWARGYLMATTEPNVALFSTVRSTRRENLFKWVGPLDSSTSELYAKRGSNLSVNSLEDARHVESIGAYNDDVDEQFLEDLGFKNIYSHINPTSIVRNLMNERIKLWIAGRLYVPQAIRGAGYSCQDIESIYTIRRTYFYVAFSKQTPDNVVEVWQQTLNEMRQDGTLDSINRRWREKQRAENRLRGCRVSAAR